MDLSVTSSPTVDAVCPDNLVFAVHLCGSLVPTPFPGSPCLHSHFLLSSRNLSFFPSHELSSFCPLQETPQLTSPLILSNVRFLSKCFTLLHSSWPVTSHFVCEKGIFFPPSFLKFRFSFSTTRFKFCLPAVPLTVSCVPSSPVKRLYGCI